MFHFKQFSIDQSGCAMKVNTDGVLLGALADAENPQTILDIGTGTGVIALMLAQRFGNAMIDAVEIDEAAAKTANNNFINSPFADRLNIFPVSFEQFFDEHPAKKYDLIVANPPFYINSLKSPQIKTNLAKHADDGFYKGLIKNVAAHLTSDGCCWLILPTDTAEFVMTLAIENYLYPQKVINVHSFISSVSHRVIIYFGRHKVSTETAKFTIYKSPGNYSEDYKKLLQPYFIAF